MKIIITGAGGFVGKELTQTLSAAHQVLPLARVALDIADRAAVRAQLLAECPDVVINCAVLGVDECEARPDRAEAINVGGPRLLAETCAEIDAEIVHLSTNYVFDGERADELFYTNDDVARPINVYGATKLAGEQAVRAAWPKSYIVRTSWVFGAGKANFFSNAARALLVGQPVRASDDLRASVTYVADLAARIVEIIARRHYAVYHVANDGCCSHYEFARAVASELNIAGDLVASAPAAEMQRLAPRPRFTPMRCLVSEALGLPPLRAWQAALPDFLSGLRA